MKIISYIIQKEFKQIFRNKGMLPVIFIMPLIQLLILSNAATFEIKNINLSIIDHDKSPYSRELINNFNASKYFKVTTKNVTFKMARDKMQQGNVDAILEIPTHFERDFIKNKKVELAASLNAINGAAAGIENVYIDKIIEGFNKNIKLKIVAPSLSNNKPKIIEASTLFWFNPELNYKTFMVPGILVLLVTMVTLFLSSMNIVREKEIGTLEQLNVTPIKKYQFIIGKLFPLWTIGIFELTIGLIIAKFVFNVPFEGSILIIYVFAAIYLMIILGMGFFISTFTNTQQQSMLLSWFFAVIFILMSGLFTPIESMPKWAQHLTIFNPIKYFVEVIRMVMLKGASFRFVLPQFIKILFFAFLMNLLAVLNYSKTE